MQVSQAPQSAAVLVLLSAAAVGHTAAPHIAAAAVIADHTAGMSNEMVPALTAFVTSEHCSSCPSADHSADCAALFQDRQVKRALMPSHFITSPSTAVRPLL